MALTMVPSLVPSMPAALRLWSFAGSALREGVSLASRHTGVPAVLVAAMALVVSWRMAKRVARFAAETALVCAALIAATALGWIRF
jgi:hypothetical protein